MSESRETGRERVSKYRKKPLVVEAIQFTNASKNECFNFVGGNRSADFEEVGACEGVPILIFDTIHGDEAIARFGDWLVKEPDGIHCYPCKPDIFEATYEPVEEEERGTLLGTTPTQEPDHD